MESIKYNLVLGSGSPRRKELLGWTGIRFTQITADIDEFSKETSPSDIVTDLAIQKARVICDSSELPENPLLITADTIVVFEGEVLGKPEDKDDARRILSKLSDNTHKVYTGIAFNKKLEGEWEEYSFFVESDVSFAEITSDLMNLYLESDEPMDKAGAYGIQGQGLLFVQNVVGSYSNVVGFPLSDVIKELKTFLKIAKNKDLRDCFVSS